MDEASTLPPFEMIDGPMEPIDRIIAWQKDIGADKPDDIMAIKHVGYVLEEMIEALDSGIYQEAYGAKALADAHIPAVSDALKNGVYDRYKSKVAMADAFTDALVFAIGGLMRLGLGPQRCIETVAISLDSKRLPDGTFVRDANGKIKKPPTFVEPDWSWINDN